MLRVFIIKFILILSVYTVAQIHPKAMVGTWSGNMNADDQELLLVFRFYIENDSLKTLIDSPKQGAFSFKANSVSFSDNFLVVKCRKLGSTFSGTVLTEKAVVNGKWQQGFNEYDLSITKTSTEWKLNRPQEPQEPFLYEIEEVIFENKEANINLSGTLSYPSQGISFPVIILVSGSGPQDRNEELMGHKPFLLIADYLTRNGFAVLRYDDRGVGESEGKFSEATTDDFFEDALAAVSFLKNHKKINSQRIGVLGHSEGGIIATRLLAENKDMAFGISLAGPTITGEEILLAQTRLVYMEEGLSEKEVISKVKTNARIYSIVKKDLEYDKAFRKIKRITLKSLSDEPNAEMISASTASQVLSPWFVRFLTLDPINYIQRIDKPYLFLFGEKDLQVPSEININKLNELPDDVKQNFSIKEFKNLNHLFQNCEKGTVSEYGLITETISPTVLKKILEWISNN